MDSSKRLNFGKLSEVIDPPNLIQNQVDSFHDFLQRDVPATHRKQAGLEAVFREVFPILSYDEKSRFGICQLYRWRIKAYGDGLH